MLILCVYIYIFRHYTQGWESAAISLYMYMCYSEVVVCTYSKTIVVYGVLHRILGMVGHYKSHKIHKHVRSFYFGSICGCDVDPVHDYMYKKVVQCKKTAW